ncbi:ATP-binding protein [Nocardia colli]|uniref:ATP-binding protein n=1 Tax=Nocardia colli TaxID=2545717 RepID=UPI0035D6DC93
MLGRQAELTLLTQWVDEGTPAIVHGAPGVGKSALLRRFAGDRAASGGDVVYLHAARLAVADVIQQLFQSFYDAPDYIPDRNRLRRLMGSVQALILVDDFEGDAEDLEHLLDAVPASDLIVSSTRQIAWSQGRSLELRGLDEDSALALLVGKLGPDSGDRTELARQLCQAAHGHPRSLLQGAAWIRQQSDAVTTVHPTELRRALLNGLPDGLRTALCALLAAGGSAISIALCQAMIGAPARPALEELEQLELVENVAAGYRLALEHHEIETAWTEPPLTASAFVDPILAWVSNDATAKQILSAAPTLIRVLEAAITDGKAAPACNLARTIAPVMAAGLQWGAWRTVLRLGESAATACGSAVDRAYFQNENQVRQRAVNVVAGITLTGGAAAGVGIGKAVSAWTARKALSTAVSSHPVAAICVATVVVAGVVGATIVAANPPAEQAQPVAVLTTALPPMPIPPEPTRPSVTSDSDLSSSAGPTCTPDPGWIHPNSTFSYVDQPGSISGTVGSRTLTDAYTLWRDCDDVTSGVIEGDGAFTISSSRCRPRRCDFTIAFTPPEPGAYHAYFVVLTETGKRLTAAALLGSTPRDITSSTPTSSVTSSTTRPPTSSSTVTPSPPPKTTSSTRPLPTIPTQ